jgi:hypothetical protein
MTTLTARIPSDVCFANPGHHLPDRVVVYTQDRTARRDQLAVVCDLMCKAVCDTVWVTTTTPLHLPAIDRARPTPPPRHEHTCPPVCAWCDGRINAKDHT